MSNLPRCAAISAVLFLFSVGCDSSPTTPPPAACTYAVAPTSLNVSAAGGPVTSSLTTASTCTWTASTSTPWLVSSPSSGTGPGTVTITAQANSTTAARSGSVIIGGITVAVQQAGSAVPCAFVITPTGANFDKGGGTGTVTVTTTAACSWQATAGAAWMSVVSGAAGAGTGTVSYRVDANPSPLGRSGTLTVAGLAFRVEQAGDVSGCTYQVSPVELSICMAWSTDLVSQITTQDGCPWTAVSTAEWMPVTEGASGTGSGSVRVRGTDNFDAPRSGAVQVRWPTVTAGQNVVVNQAGCSYAVTQNTFAFGSGGGTGRFDVLQQSDPILCGGPLQNGCLWSPVPNVPWITITSPTTRVGDDTVVFSVDANGTGAARTGTVTVRDKVVRINQQ